MNKLLDELSRRKACELYQSGLSLEAVSRAVNSTIPRIRRALKANDIQIRSRVAAVVIANTKRAIAEDRQAAICKLYTSGYSMDDIAILTKTPRTTVKRTLDRCRMDIRTRGEALKLRTRRRRESLLNP